jgi:hypothetical protein
MAEQRDQIVKRVVHALDSANDSTDIVGAYFDTDREVILEAARQTLEATREDVSPDRLTTIVDRELVEALRFPVGRGDGLLPRLYLGRKRVAITSALVTIGSVLAFLLL